jgi:hypothetical protein
MSSTGAEIAAGEPNTPTTMKKIAVPSSVAMIAPMEYQTEIRAFIFTLPSMRARPRAVRDRQSECLKTMPVHEHRMRGDSAFLVFGFCFIRCLNNFALLLHHRLTASRSPVMLGLTYRSPSSITKSSASMTCTIAFGDAVCISALFLS